MESSCASIGSKYGTDVGDGYRPACRQLQHNNQLALWLDFTHLYDFDHACQRDIVMRISARTTTSRTKSDGMMKHQHLLLVIERLLVVEEKVQGPARSPRGKGKGALTALGT